MDVLCQEELLNADYSRKMWKMNQMSPVTLHALAFRVILDVALILTNFMLKLGSIYFDFSFQKYPTSMHDTKVIH